MKEMIIQVVANDIPETDVDFLDELLCELFNTEDVVITTQVFEGDING